MFAKLVLRIKIVIAVKIFLKSLKIKL